MSIYLTENIYIVYVDILFFRTTNYIFFFLIEEREKESCVFKPKKQYDREYTMHILGVDVGGTNTGRYKSYFR